MPGGAQSWEKAIEFWANALGVFEEIERGAFNANPRLGAKLAKDMCLAAETMCKRAIEIAELESGS